MLQKEYDGIVVGAGPNGLAAAITMQQAGLSILLVEAKDTIGGGTRSAELTRPGYMHDICSAIHPMAVISPFFKKLPLEQYGLKFIQPEIAAAHPFDDGQAAALYKSVEQTALELGIDENIYLKLMQPLVKNSPELFTDVMGPLHFPKHPVGMARFGWKALPSAVKTGQRFQTEKAKGLWAGIAAHAMQPLTNTVSSAIGLMLILAGHATGWPLPKGGSQAIADALASYFIALGGEIETGFHVSSLDQLPKARSYFI